MDSRWGFSLGPLFKQMVLVHIGELLYLSLGPPPVADSRRPVHLAEGLLCR